MARLEQENGKGFGKGVSAMRDLMMAEFGAMGNGMFTGYEIAQLIGDAPGPMPSRDDDGKEDPKE